MKNRKDRQIRDKRIIRLLEAGYVRQREFCKLIGRADGGQIQKLAKKHGVDFHLIPMNGKKGWNQALYWPDDASKIPPPRQKRGKQKQQPKAQTC